MRRTEERLHTEFRLGIHLGELTWMVGPEGAL